LTISRPVLWSLERPYLYRVVSRVMCGSTACDNYATPFGVRSFVFRADSGFYLNGKAVKIRGVCLHHDLGALGAAVNTRAIERQLEIMKAMGANSLRTSHNPPAPALLARALAGIVRGLDPTRPVTQAANNGSPANPVFHAGALDLLGHNYHHEVWKDFPTQYPGAKFIITEAMSDLNSRGVYEQPSDSVANYYWPYDKTKGPQPPANGRLSSYDNSHAFWGSLHEESLRLFER